MCERHREPIKVNREPITYYTDNNIYGGGWYAFPKPDERAPHIRKLKSRERILWCPWCGEWTIYSKVKREDRWECTGICQWANTQEWYVKTYNDLWFEDVPLRELKKMSMPVSSKKRK